MGRKLSDISKEIDSKAQLFRWRLERMMSSEVMSFIEKLSKECDLYIFSGVIRDYFLNAVSNRDIDIVFDGQIDLEKFLISFPWAKNSFGGYKVKIDDVNIDMWRLKDTWAFGYQKAIDYDLSRVIPNTAFFNFSSIVYHYNNNRFYHTPQFVKFMKDREIDITYYPNANIPLCVVNSFYYSEKLGLPLGKNLINYIKQKFRFDDPTYSEVQRKHFGKVLFSNEDLLERIKVLQ